LPADLAKHVSGQLIGAGVFLKAEAEPFNVILPGLSYVEKSGTLVNWMGKEQKIQKALEPAGQSRSVADLTALWSSSNG